MSLFTKNCLRISGLAALLGIVFVCIALVSGVDVNGANRKNYVLDFNSDYDQDITSIKIDLSFVNVKIERGNTFSIDARNMNKDTFQSYVENDVWIVRDDEQKKFKLFGHALPIFYNDGNEKYSVTITVPDDFAANKIDIEIGAGRVNLCDIEAKKIDFEVGAGVLYASRLVVTDGADLEVGAGKMEIKDLEATDVNLECGVGEMVISGDIKGISSADCGMGHMKLNLAQPESSYNYDLSCGIGNININGSNYSFTSDSNIRNDDAIYDFTIDCGVGSVEVSNQ